MNGYRCEVNYDMKNDSTIDVYRTFVAPELRGKGAAAELLAAVSEFARQRNLKIVPTCSYAVVYYKKHREYQSLLSADTDLEKGGSCRLPPKQG